MNLTCTVVRKIGREQNLQSPYRLKGKFKVEFLRFVPYGRRSEVIARKKPSSVESLVHIRFVVKSKRKVQTGSHRTI